ncbi:uncharacterized protein LOC133202024 [Saccostrea echinata]|uniref:uncharacterized protein LOC133202024 n=1 Tax=Saccostrea echinata TaxID=191078 RepID=UPI002A8113EE|nr:uncharacterized protein LOC133202024 [Saccostrea echinata]
MSNSTNADLALLFSKSLHQIVIVLGNELKESTLEPKVPTLEPKEPKKIMILGENDCNVPTRKSSENYLISRGWESIFIFNDLNGAKKSEIAIVFDDNEGTCLPLPSQEDFTPFLMMSIPTEPVFGIQAKPFTLNISGIGISCDRHSNSRMLQVSYRAIKEPTQFCTLTDNKVVPDAFSSCVYRCDCPDPAHCRDVNLYLFSGNAKGAWSLCEVKATNS